MLLFSASTIFAGTFQGNSLKDGVLGKSGAPTITTEKAVYLTGETVVIRGAGFRRFEEIKLEVGQYDDQLRQDVLRGMWTVFADGKGNFVR